MICLDIDGVIANPYEEVNRRVAEAGYKVVDWEDWTQFDVAALYDWAPKQFVKGLFRDKLVMKNAIPFSDTWYWINDAVNSKGQNIVCITYRAKHLDTVTWNWFYDWNIPVTDIVHVNSGTKSQAIREAEFHHGPCKFFVEDKASNAAEVASEGYESYLINRPYNRYDEPGAATRIDSLWEINYG